MVDYAIIRDNASIIKAIIDKMQYNTDAIKEIEFIEDLVLTYKELKKECEQLI